MKVTATICAVEPDVHVRQAELLVGLCDLARHAADVEQVDAALQQRERGRRRLGLRGRGDGRLLGHRGGLARERAAAGGDGRRGICRGDLAGAGVFVDGASLRPPRASPRRWPGWAACLRTRRGGPARAPRRQPRARRAGSSPAASCATTTSSTTAASTTSSATASLGDCLRRGLEGVVGRARCGDGRLVLGGGRRERLRLLGLAQRRHLGGELGRRLAPGALAGLRRVAGERARLGRLGGAEAREPAGELLPLGLGARQLGLEALDLGVLVLERLPEGVALGVRVARRRRSGRGRGSGGRPARRRTPARSRTPARRRRPTPAARRRRTRCASRARGRCWPAQARPRQARWRRRRPGRRASR